MSREDDGNVSWPSDLAARLSFQAFSFQVFSCLWCSRRGPVSYPSFPRPLPLGRSVSTVHIWLSYDLFLGGGGEGGCTKAKSYHPFAWAVTGYVDSKNGSLFL